MQNLNQSNLALFFTRGMSLAKWDKLGMLRREIRTYQELATHFKTIYFFTYGERDASYASLLPSNIHIIEKPTWIPSNFYSLVLPFVHRAILKKVTILKTNQMDGSWAAVIAKKLFNKKLVVRCGYEWLSFIEKGNRAKWKKIFAYMVEKFAYTNADKVIITSQDDRDFIINRFAIAPSTVQVIPNYIDTQKFKPLPVLKESDRVLFLGRFEDQKNLFNLVKGMEGLSVRLVMIGSGSQKEQLITLAKECGVTIEFLGNISQDEIPNELNKSQVFVLPSLYEGNPKALLEAMSCAIPCVGTRAPGIDNVLTDGKDGILCELDAVSIHEALKRVLEDQQLRDRIGQGARETILSTFSLEKVLEKELALHTSLL